MRDNIVIYFSSDTNSDTDVEVVANGEFNPKKLLLAVDALEKFSKDVMRKIADNYKEERLYITYNV